MEDIIILRLDFTKRSLGTAYKWWVQIPEGRGHRTVGFSNSRKSKSGDTGIDLTIDNLVRDGAPITIHITQPRSDLEVYDATVDGIVVARATRFKAGPKFEFLSWQVEVAKGFDLTLVRCNYPWLKGRLIPYEHHADLLTGRRHLQNAGVAPIDQGLGHRRDQTFVRIQSPGEYDDQGALDVTIHGADVNIGDHGLRHDDFYAYGRQRYHASSHSRHDVTRVLCALQQDMFLNLLFRHARVANSSVC
jgi:hypothetical protein